MNAPVDPLTLPLCQRCGERVHEVDGVLEVFYQGWDPGLPLDECRGRRVVGELRYEGHVVSTLAP